MASGLFDFQVNGFAGVDFQSDGLRAAELCGAVDAMRRHGLAGIFATLVTDSIDALCRRFEAMENIRSQHPAVAAMIVGYHLEGPWLNPAPGFRGAHAAEPMHAPVWEEFERLQQAAAGRIRMVTIAPEWPGSPEFIAQLRRAGVHVSLGHTDANDAQIDAAIQAGARFCTHLGNGVPAVMPRHDNVTQRLLARDELIACFIPDGIHLPPFVLRNFSRAKPAGRVLFTTDCMAGAGAPPGWFTLGSMRIKLDRDGVVRQPGGEGFAGSALTPDEGVRRTARFLGLSEAEARRLWSDAALAAFGVTLSEEQAA